MSAEGRPPWRGDWEIVHRCGSAAELVQAPREPSTRQACFVRPDDAAIVLGSTEAVADVDLVACQARGYALLRRGSGGGSVIVGPRAQVWLDLFVPYDDPLAESDVGAATRFVGQVWHDALRPLLEPAAKLAVYSGALIESRWSKKVCFSGLGPGEVLLDGKKVVGVAQRRNRKGAWFFTMAPLSFEPSIHAALLQFDQGIERDELSQSLGSSVAVLPSSLEEVEQALIQALS